MLLLTSASTLLDVLGSIRTGTVYRPEPPSLSPLVWIAVVAAAYAVLAPRPWLALPAAISLAAWGMTRHAFTRVYFADDPELDRDPVLALVPEERRPTLLARAAGQRDGATLYRFDIRVQGERETVFFDI